MLTPERHKAILETVNKHHTVKMKCLVEQTGASESTIRRDLDQLEQQGLLRRVHGGASLRHSASEELSMGEKSTKFHQEKIGIARYAATLIRDGDCVFMDAGTTTYEMIPFLSDKDITVVTNGLNHLDALTDQRIETYVLGGYVKHKTKAVVGINAIQSLNQFRFDLCFIGTNGITIDDGYTTPDPEEAAIKRTALSLAREKYIVADHSKFDEVSFSKFGNIEDATVVTDDQGQSLNNYKLKTNIKVVTT